MLTVEHKSFHTCDRSCFVGISHLCEEEAEGSNQKGAICGTLQLLSEGIV